MVKINTKFRNRNRVSTRLWGYDYSQDGAYFVTICTKNRMRWFGQIINGKMQLSEIGQIVKNEWLKTSKIRQNVVLGAWVIMPDHFHGIVVIRNGGHYVGTQCIASRRCQQQQSPTKYKNQFGPQSRNLASIIRGFKSSCTKQIHIAGYSNFAWQSRYYDRIIRNRLEYNRITKYILNNPRNWD